MATQTIYTNNDTNDYQESPNFPDGGDAYVIFKWHDGWQHKRAYFGFNITSAPAASTVTSVTFTTYFNTYGNDMYVNFRRVIESWDEDTLTWNNAPNTTTSNEYTHFLPNVDATKSYDITNLYKDAKNAGNDLSIRLYLTQNYNAGAIITSKEQGTGASIVITYGTITDYYVKTTGNDSLGGDSWINAWKTINKAATTVTDGKTVHIGFGAYTSSGTDKIAPQNIGALGISYLPETATTGGGTGSVTITKT